MPALTFHLIPHTHWDREWFLSRAAFQARLAPLLDDVLVQLENDSTARFLLDGQTILLEDYLAVHPENEARLVAQVQRGALEIGPWYVLSDLLIPSAASLRRNLEEGTRDTARFGKRLDVLYSPDAFGHPAGLPHLAAEFGIHRAVVRRGLGLPLDFYRWEGDSGESLLVHHLPKGGYDVAIDLAGAGDRLQELWQPLRQELVERAVTPEIAVFLGADHHRMVPNVSELQRRLQQLEPSATVRISGLTEFFDAVENTAVDFSVVRGELRRGGGHSWVLQGVHATRSRLKRRHGQAEWLLERRAGPLAQAALERKGVDREGLLRLAWRTLLQAQFHDTLAGTTSDAVQEEQAVRLHATEALAREITTASLRDLSDHDPDAGRNHPERVKPALVLWNPSRFERRGIVVADLTFFRHDILIGAPNGRKPLVSPGFFPFALRKGDGETISVQVLSVESGEERLDAPRHYPDQDAVDRVRVVFRAPVMKPREILLLKPVPSDSLPANDGLMADDKRLANRFVAIEPDENGDLALTDLRSGEVYLGLFRLIFEADKGDLYTFSSDGEAPSRLVHAIGPRLVASGPLAATMEMGAEIDLVQHGSLRAVATVTLCADSPAIRVLLEIDSNLSDLRLRLRLPIGVAEVMAGAALGVERRDSVVNQSPKAIEQEVATAPAHRFVSVAHGNRGLAVFSREFFEYEVTANGELLITILRAVGELSRNDLPERPGHAAWPMPTPDAQERGTHLIEMVVMPGGEDLFGSEVAIERLAEELLWPIEGIFLRDYTRGEV